MTFLFCLVFGGARRGGDIPISSGQHSYSFLRSALLSVDDASTADPPPVRFQFFLSAAGKLGLDPACPEGLKIE